MGERSLLIAGPGRSFGVELAERFHEEGYDIAAIGRTPRSLVSFKNALRAKGIGVQIGQADLGNLAQVNWAVSGFAVNMPPWQCVAYCVKQSSRGSLFSMRPDVLAQDFRSNVIGALVLTQAVIYGWQKLPNASILVASGSYADTPDSSNLSLVVSTGALHSLALSMEPVLRPSGIAVKEMMIDEAVETGGIIEPAAVAEQFYRAHRDRSEQVVYTIHS